MRPQTLRRLQPRSIEELASQLANRLRPLGARPLLSIAVDRRGSNDRLGNHNRHRQLGTRY
jgi:hypothetical protein